MPRKKDIAIPVSERAANYRSKNFLHALDQLPTDQCVLWRGEPSDDGYPITRYNGHKTVAHRAMWTEIMGHIPDGMALVRVCHNKMCVNPRHGELITQREAIARAPNHNRDKTHCAKGHPYTPENTKATKDKNGKVVARVCITCRNERNRLTDARRKAERNAQREGKLARIRAAELAARAARKGAVK